jgi:hypothetical protein
MTKDRLTIEQSARLIELGVDARKAHESDIYGRKSIFTLADLLSLLPKEIEDENNIPYHLNIDYPYLIGGVSARYLDEDGDSLTGVLCPELIDALYELLIYILQNFSDMIKNV